MKAILLFLTFTVSFSFAQTGINYQGAATDSDGAKQVDQNISLRISVLQGGVDGTTSYSETHNTTTDQFGLFNVVIGQGEVVSGDFEGISWGSGDHFLKVELDATGGTNYSLVSTTQMMSVPYALHAENAGLDSAAVADMVESMSISGNNIYGCDLKFPEGISDNIIYEKIQDYESYNVPNGKRLYITNFYPLGYSIFINEVLFNISNLSQPIIANPNDIITTTNDANIEIHGFLSDVSSEINVFNLEINDLEPLTVPNGKIFVATNICGTDYNPIRINGVQFHLNESNHPIIFDSDLMITPYNSSMNFSINGYLVDEDYFADCGGGGGSSSSTSSGLSSNSGGGANTMDLSVSQFGDTLFGLGNDFLIIPGISEANHNIQEYGTVTDIDGNTYNTLVYGDNEWMIENLRTNIGDYTEVSAGSFDEYTENVGNYYSGNTLTDVCPTGWHVATMQDWQDFHFDIFESEMYDNGFTNSENEILDFDGEILWSNEFGGSNQSGFNLFNTGWYVINNGNIHDSENSTSFWVDEECDILGEKKVVNIFSSGLNQYLIHVSCSNPSDAKFQIRCVKEQEHEH